MSQRAVTITAKVTKAETTKDGGWKLTFETDSGYGPEILQVAEMHDLLVELQIALSESIPVEPPASGGEVKDALASWDQPKNSAK